MSSDTPIPELPPRPPLNDLLNAFINEVDQDHVYEINTWLDRMMLRDGVTHGSIIFTCMIRLANEVANHPESDTELMATGFADFIKTTARVLLIRRARQAQEHS